MSKSFISADVFELAIIRSGFDARIFSSDGAFDDPVFITSGASSRLNVVQESFAAATMFSWAPARHHISVNEPIIVATLFADGTFTVRPRSSVYVSSIIWVSGAGWVVLLHEGKINIVSKIVSSSFFIQFTSGALGIVKVRKPASEKLGAS